MRIIEVYSHLNGLEYLRYHRERLWDEIQEVVVALGAPSGEADFKASFERLLRSRDWVGRRSETSVGNSFVKERAEIELLLQAGTLTPCELFARQTALYGCDAIDVGIDVVPMSVMGIVRPTRERRGEPRVPLVLIGVEPIVPSRGSFTAPPLLKK